MPRSRFVQPDTVMLPLSDGDWLLVKRRLNSGEQRAAFRRMYVTAADGSFVTDEEGKPKIDPTMIGVTLVTAYLLDWSLVDHSGEKILIARQPPEVLTAAVDLLETDDYDEIRTAIEDHDSRQRLAREEEKKRLATVTTSPTTSPSLDAATGAMSGSAISTPMST
jgi:hypothetical protein